MRHSRIKGELSGRTWVEGLTRFYASGPDAARFLQLSTYGLDIRFLGERIGDASALKMVYAASTKGYSALVTELLIAAKALGIYESLIAKTFEEVGLTPKIFEGAAAMFDFVGNTPLAEETPETHDASRTLDQALEILVGITYLDRGRTKLS